MVGKFIVICRADGMLSIHEEAPLCNQIFDEYFIALPINVYITGDLAFYATVLGKENMGGIWCPWCMLSKQEWSADPHELWRGMDD